MYRYVYVSVSPYYMNRTRKKLFSAQKQYSLFFQITVDMLTVMLPYYYMYIK